MTPLAAKVARDLTALAKDRRCDDRAGVLDLFEQDMHCFEVTAISKSVNEVLDGPHSACDPDEAWEVWRDIESMLPRMFLPSPVTWLETMFSGSRIAIVLWEKGDFFSLAFVQDSLKGPFSLHLCDFRPRSILHKGGRIEVVTGQPEDNGFLTDRAFDAGKLVGKTPPASLTGLETLLNARREVVQRNLEMAESAQEVLQMANRFIGMAVLTLDLINTPGLIGLKLHRPHNKIARKLRYVGAGKYPLHAWSEVVLKHQTKVAPPEERFSGLIHHKCLHFVRSHLRHYRDGKITMIPAHWRGDPALGIKRTRYRMAA